MKNRLISSSIQQKNKSVFGRILVITGARQTGKTTLVKHLYPDYAYVSIEDPVVVDQYKSLTAAQWELNFPLAIIDEIQKEPQIVESIKSVYDQFSEPKYIILGSSQIMLLKKIRETLAGRCSIFDLYPLTLPELLTNSWQEKVSLSYFQNLVLHNNVNDLPIKLQSDYAIKSNAFKHYLMFGGYPALSGNDTSDEEKYDWLSNYIRTYLERDIRDLADIRNLEPFTKAQQLMALRTGTILNNSQLAAESGVTSKTIARFVEYMKLSYQLIILQPWHKNAGKRLVKSPKIHFMDVGILRALLKKRGELTGLEFESAIISEIYKQIKTAGIEASLFHFRTFDGREIDLLLETESAYIAIEIKKTNTVRKVDGRSLIGLEEFLNKPVKHKIIVSNDENIRNFDEGITAIPAMQFLT